MYNVTSTFTSNTPFVYYLGTINATTASVSNITLNGYYGGVSLAGTSANI
jgi:hypothetical protein